MPLNSLLTINELGAISTKFEREALLTDTIGCKVLAGCDEYLSHPAHSCAGANIAGTASCSLGKTLMAKSILCISGSLRSGSYNSHLLDHLAGYLPQMLARDFLFPQDVDLPMFNEDVEGDAIIRGKVAQLHGRFAACDALIVASPEYNGQLTAYLKNLIDWVSRLAYIDPSFTNPFIDKPLLLCSASTGSSGGMAGITHARALFGYVGALVMGGAICVPYASEKWSEMGYMFDEPFEGYIAGSINRLTSLMSQPSK